MTPKIQANELRVGNWVRINETNTCVICIFETSCELLIGSRKRSTSLFEVEPIPITPEILEKCGFENDGGEFSHPNNTDFDLMFSCSENGLWCAYNYGGEFHGPFPERNSHGVVANPICNPFKYLHQLQNLYFALTGEELTINL